MTVFKYIRLSKADKDLKFKTESESIANQRALLDSCIDTRQDLRECFTEEFVDDGYSGTNDARPAFERMIERVKNGEADVIICKDFSRFFRDYVEIGDYLERIFPFLGVRFISVNDGYDSSEYKGSTAGMDVVMRYIVYSSYSRDLSKKVKAVFNAKKKKGQWIGSSAPFGYIKDKSNKNRLIPNPETAHIVRRIFDLALSGKKTAEIALILNTEGVITPSAYFKSVNPDSKKFSALSEQVCWSSVNVKRILRTRLYTGAMVSNTKRWKSIDNPKTTLNDESEWIVVPNCHEAIVSDEEFKKAQSAIRGYTRTDENAPKDYPLRSLVVCGICGRAMERHPQSKRKYYVCSRSKSNPNTDCPVKEKFYEDDIERVVIGDLREKLVLFADNQRKLHEANKAAVGTKSNILYRIEQAQKLLKKKSYERHDAYERYVDKRISKDEFIVIKRCISEEEERIKSEIEKHEAMIQEAEQNKRSVETQAFEKATEFLSAENVTNDMLLFFVDKVKVYSGGGLEIVYRFADLFEMR